MSEFQPGEPEGFLHVIQHEAGVISIYSDGRAVEPGNRGWQPIETAPRDGTMVLVNDTTEGWTAWVAASWSEGEEWTGWVYDDATSADSNPLGPRPTHWLLVPPLPGSAGEQR
jgi:hypothetical protein